MQYLPVLSPRPPHDLCYPSRCAGATSASAKRARLIIEDQVFEYLKRAAVIDSDMMLMTRTVFGKPIMVSHGRQAPL